MGYHHAGVLSQLAGVQLVAVAEPDRTRREAAAGRWGTRVYEDFHEMLKNEHPDAVTVATPDTAHVEPVLAALAAGCHVFVEKPLARSVANARRMVEAAAAAGRQVMVSHLLRFDPRYARAREMVRQGKVGELLAAHALHNVVTPPWIAAHSNIEFNVSIHMLDLIAWLANRPIRSVYALKAEHRTARIEEVRGGAEPRPRTEGVRGSSGATPRAGGAQGDAGPTSRREAVQGGAGPVAGEVGQVHLIGSIAALLELEGGVLASLHNAWSTWRYFPGNIQSRLEIVGTRGALQVEAVEPGLTLYAGGEAAYPDWAYWPEMEGRFAGALREALAAFVESVEGGRRVPVTAEEGMAAVAAAAALQRSAQSGTRVYLGDAS